MPLIFSIYLLTTWLDTSPPPSQMHQVAKSRDGAGHGQSEEVVCERPIKPEPVLTTLPRPLKSACEICRSDVQQGELGEQKNAAGKVAGELIVAERAAAKPSRALKDREPILAVAARPKANGGEQLAEPRRPRGPPRTAPLLLSELQPSPWRVIPSQSKQHWRHRGNGKAAAHSMLRAVSALKLSAPM